MKFKSPLAKPSAWIPVALSLVALTMVLIHYAMYGIARETDAGTLARIFQLIMIAQVPFVGFGAIRWLPEDTRAGLIVLAVQIAAALAAIFSVVFFT
jgi:hypothetical protein